MVPVLCGRHGCGKARTARADDDKIVSLGFGAFDFLNLHRDGSLQCGQVDARLTRSIDHRALESAARDRGARDGIHIHRLVLEDILGELFNRHSAHQARFGVAGHLDVGDLVLAYRHFQ